MDEKEMMAIVEKVREENLRLRGFIWRLRHRLIQARQLLEKAMESEDGLESDDAEDLCLLINNDLARTEKFKNENPSGNLKA